MHTRARWVLPLLAALAVPAVPGPGAGQAGSGGRKTVVLIPFDIGQGAVTNVEGPTPYVASVKLQVALGLGTGAPLRLGPVAAVRYANPDWTVAAGVRAQWLPLRFGLGGRRWGVGVAAEQLWDTAGDQPFSAGPIADLELVRLFGWLVHDWRSERTGFELGIGTDLRSLWAVLFPSKDEPPFSDVN